MKPVTRKVRSIADILTYPIAVAVTRWIAVLWLLSLPVSDPAPHLFRWALGAYAIITTFFVTRFWLGSRPALRRDEPHPLALPVLIAIDVIYAALAAKLYGVTILALVPAIEVAILPAPIGLGLVAAIGVALVALVRNFQDAPLLGTALQVTGLMVGPYLAAAYGLQGLRRAEHQIRAIDQVLHSGSELGTQLSLSDVLAQLLNLLGVFRRIVPWDTCVVYVVQYDETAGEEMLVAAEISGTNARAYRGTKIAFGTGVVGYAATKQRAALIGDLHKDARQPDTDSLPQAHGSLVLPIVSDGQTVGCVQLIASKPNVYTAEQLGLVGRLISLSAAGVRSALLHSRTRAMADTDSLTGVLSSRAYHERLEQEFRKAQAARKSLSLLIIDVDNFKRINDTYGLPAGDEVLRRIGTLLRQQRRNDVCCRYGGDEFIVVMPETIKSEAAVVAARLRETVEDMTFAFNGSPAKATVSIGAASYPQDVTSKQALIEAADDALSAAKQNGRNALSVFEPNAAAK